MNIQDLTDEEMATLHLCFIAKQNQLERLLANCPLLDADYVLLQSYLNDITTLANKIIGDRFSKRAGEKK